MSSNNSNSEQRTLDQLSEPYYSIAMEHHTSKFRDPLGENWADFLDEKIQNGISETVWEIFWMMGGTRNRCKPIGLFFDKPELVKETDTDFFSPERKEKSPWNSAERKRRSLIESVEYYTFWHENQNQDYTTPRCSMEAIIRPTAEILRESRLPMPDFPTEEGFEYIEEYAEDRLQDIHTSRDQNGTLRHD